MNKAYILGGSQTDFERNWKKEGKGVVALLKEVTNDAFKNTKMTDSIINELSKENKVSAFVGNFISEYYINQGHLGALLTKVNHVFYGIPSARYEAACASGSVALDAAITKIEAGLCDLAIVIGFELMKTVDSKLCGDYLGRAAYYENEGEGIDFPFPKLFGKLADEMVKKYDLDEDRFNKSLARIACINYENAKRNGNAQTRKWFMNEKNANDRGSKTNNFIGGMLAISDCSQVTDGAACVILCSEKFINDNKIDRELPYIKAHNCRVAPFEFKDKIEDSKDSEYVLKWTRQAVLDSYKQADLTINDMDFIETHDCFTSSEYMAISALGITEPGKEYEAIENHLIDFDGRFPINASGGLIGCGHPVGATGVRMMLDLYKQVTNQAGTYQVKNARNGIMLNIGGSATTNYTFIVGV